MQRNSDRATWVLAQLEAIQTAVEGRYPTASDDFKQKAVDNCVALWAADVTVDKIDEIIKVMPG